MHGIPLVAGSDVDDVLFVLMPYVAKNASAKRFRSGASYSIRTRMFSDDKA
jgi:hypothetical protein